MSWRRKLSKIRNIFRRNTESDDLDEEIRIHLGMEEQEQINAGVPTEEARFAARRRFGNVTGAQERSRAMWGWRWVEVLLQDLRYGARQLRRNLGFTTVAVLTFALGIGAMTAIFSVVHAVLLRPLPYREPGRLVDLLETENAPGRFPLCGADYLDWQAQSETMESMSLYSFPDVASASGGGEAEPAAVLPAQANFFDLLGVKALRGRTFLRGEDAEGKDKVAVLSYGFWQRHFGGSAGAVGRTVVLNSEVYSIVGIMPEGFHFRYPVDIWVPLDMSLKKLGQRGSHSWRGIGRMKPGVTLARARAEMLAISKRLEKQYPDSNNKAYAVLTPLNEVLTGDSKLPLLVLWGAVMLLLAVACVNVANLQLARASTRQREMAVRASLGAGRLRLIRQVMTESVLLALIGAAAGIGGAWLCVRLLEKTPDVAIPLTNPVQLDGTVLAFAIAASVLAGLLFGLAPALQASDFALSGELKLGTQAVLTVARGRQALRDGLVVLEISITLALLVGAGLLLRSFVNLRRADMGLNPENVMTTFIRLPEKKYTTMTERRQFFDQLLERVSASPKVANAALSSELPLQGGNSGYLRVDGVSDPKLESLLVGLNHVTTDYFRALGVPTLAGRTFIAGDLERTAKSAEKMAALPEPTDGSSVKAPADVSMPAVISNKTARLFWKNQNSIGRTFRWNGFNVTVIGVVGDVREYGLRVDMAPQVYFPFTLDLPEAGYGYLAVKTRGTDPGVAEMIRRRVHELDSALAPSKPQTMEQLIADDNHDVSLQAFLLSALATLALVLAAVGLYGLMSYLVTQRTREIGIRMALGAERSSVLSLIMRQGVKLTVLGMVIGTCMALGLTHVLRDLLYGVTPNDPWTFGSVAGVLAVVSLIAYYLPALRATKVDPMLALRHE